MNYNWLAIAGVSRDETKFGRLVFESLRKRTDRLLPINPNIDPFEDKRINIEIIKKIGDSKISTAMLNKISKTLLAIFFINTQ